MMHHRMSPQVMAPIITAAIHEFTHRSVTRGVWSVVSRSPGSQPRWTSAEQEVKAITAGIKDRAAVRRHLEVFRRVVFTARFSSGNDPEAQLHEPNFPWRMASG